MRKLKTFIFVTLLFISQTFHALSLTLENSHISNIQVTGGSFINIGCPTFAVACPPDITPQNFCYFLISMICMYALYKYMTKHTNNSIQLSDITERAIMHISGITSIDISDIGHLTIQQCPSNEDETLIITTRTNIAPLLNIEQSGSHLSLGVKNNTYIPAETRVNYCAILHNIAAIHARNGTQVTIDKPIQAELLKLYAHNNASIIAQINTDKLEITGSNNAIIQLAGSANQQTISLTNAATAGTLNLPCNDTIAAVHNASEASINAKNSFSYNVTNGSLVHYSGIPEIGYAICKDATIQQII